MSKSINIGFPLKDSNINQLFQTNSTTKNAYLSDLLLLLLTNAGERYMDPNYGTNLLQYIFDPTDNLTENNVIASIKKTVKAYIPTLTINNVVFNQSEQENQLNVNIFFTYDDGAFQESSTLSMTF